MRLHAPSVRSFPTAAAFVLLCCAGGMAHAQHGGSGGGGGMRGGGPGFAGGSHRGPGDFGRGLGGQPADRSPDSNATTMRRGLQLGPPGRWWDEKHFAKQLQLRPDQQRQMDTTFETNRSVLLKCFGDLQQEQSRMEVLTRAKTLDESSLFAQIDRVAEARADLEKANTHFLLQIRSEMDADQIARLEGSR